MSAVGEGPLCISYNNSEGLQSDFLVVFSVIIMRNNSEFSVIKVTSIPTVNSNDEKISIYHLKSLNLNFTKVFVIILPSAI